MPGFLGDSIYVLGQGQRIYAMEKLEQRKGVPDLVLLQVSDEMPTQAGRKFGDLGACFLDLTFAEENLPGRRRRPHTLGWMRFGHGDQSDFLHRASALLRGLGNPVTHALEIFFDVVHGSLLHEKRSRGSSLQRSVHEGGASVPPANSRGSQPPRLRHFRSPRRGQGFRLTFPPPSSLTASMLRQLVKWIFRLALLVFVAVAIFLINLIWFRPWSLNLFYEKVFALTVFDEPELLSMLGIAEQFGITSHNGKLNDVSPAHQQKVLDNWKTDLVQLKQYPLRRQTKSQQLSTHILEWFVQDQIDGEKWQWHNYPVNQLFGVQNEFPSFMANTHRLLSGKDCEYYIMRLNALPKKFEGALEGIRVRESRGIVPPRFVVDEVIKEMSDFVGKPVAENVLASSFKTRLAKIASLSDKERADFQARVEAAVGATVYPAYQKLIDHFRELQPRTTTDDGAWKLPEGDAFYAYCLRSNTTTSLEPNAVHDLGLSEVARIETEMHALLDANGFAGQAIGPAMTKLREDPRFLFPNDNKGRQDMLAEYTRLIENATERSKQLFLTIPKARCEVRRVPVFKEATSSGAYYIAGAQDGTRPGIFFANLREVGELPKWSMPTLAYHEGVPGHHFQLSTAQELTGVPQFRKVIPFTAYMEGWALYCEWLVKQSGWYENDPFGDLGRLQGELFRAVRLVVDTGIHAKRWKREDAIVYMKDKTGMGDKEVTAEIERYIVNPGQACAYKIGMLKSQEVRAKAQQALGDKFDQREFHDAVLKNGALPLDILAEQIDDYIKSKQTAPATKS